MTLAEVHMLHDISSIKAIVKSAIVGAGLGYSAPDTEGLIMQAFYRSRPIATFVVSGEKNHTITMVGVGAAIKILEARHCDEKGLISEICGWLSSQLVARIDQIFADLSAVGFRKVE